MGESDEHADSLAGMGPPAEAPTRTTAAGRAVPRELPGDVSGFVGRDEQLAELDWLLTAATIEPAVVLTALSGAAGIGKTALAVRWAHRVAGRFPDGQLYVNLRGYDPAEPLSPADALAGFLRSFGVDGARVPGDLAERTARYRSLLADRRMLVVLDNAQDAEQVRPLLPGSPSCLVVVTSRDALPGLVARDGAVRIVVDALAPLESTALLRSLVGRRVDAEPDAAAALVGQCGGLPLALRVAAELAAANSAAPLAELVEGLRDEQRRLDVLDAGGDPQVAIRAVFSWSLRHLPEPAADAFSLLGLHPGGEVDAYALAALAGVSPVTGQRLLGELARAHLVQRLRRSRFGMHDLLRAYAAEQAAARFSPDLSWVALTRLFDYYRYAAAVATVRMFHHHPPAQYWHNRPHEVVAVPPLGDRGQALAWLDQERANLVAVCGYAARHGWPAHCVDLSQILHTYLDTQYYTEGLAVHGHAASVAPARGRVRAGVLTSLGIASWRLGHSTQAVAQLHEALSNHQAAAAEGDVASLDEPGRTVAERVTRTALGLAFDGLGRFEVALEHKLAGLAIAQASGDRAAEAKQLYQVGYALWRLERYRESVDYCQRAAEAARESGLRRFEAQAALGLGEAYTGLGRLSEALSQLDTALAWYVELAERRSEGFTREAMGVVLRRQGRYQEAVAQLEQAVSISTEIDDQWVRAQALNTLGETLLAMGRPGPARQAHLQALALAREIAHLPEQTRARAGLDQLAAYRSG